MNEFWQVLLIGFIFGAIAAGLIVWACMKDRSGAVRITEEPTEFGRTPL